MKAPAPAELPWEPGNKNPSLANHSNFSILFVVDIGVKIPKFDQSWNTLDGWLLHLHAESEGALRSGAVSGLKNNSERSHRLDDLDLAVTSQR